jgi:hypothetical protein
MRMVVMRSASASGSEADAVKLLDFLTTNNITGVRATSNGVAVVVCVLVFAVEGGDPGEEVGEGGAGWEGGVTGRGF